MAMSAHAVLRLGGLFIHRLSLFFLDLREWHRHRLSLGRHAKACSYNNFIIIVTNVVYFRILFCLICTSRRSVTILSCFNTSYNIIMKASKLLINFSF